METELTEQENSRALEMLTHIEANPDITQVTLADELGVAVGTINWYLKRLISKGYVKVRRAQRKKLRYIITPEGIALRANLTVDYIKTSLTSTAACANAARAALSSSKPPATARSKSSARAKSPRSSA